jgi:hypothetical protein
MAGCITRDPPAAIAASLAATRLRRRPLEILLHLLHLADDAHPSPAPAVRRLEDHGQAVFHAKLFRLLFRRHGTIRAGHDRDT